MIVANSFAGKQCAVLGLGLSGLSAVRALLAGGAGVLAWDDTAAVREKAAAQGLELTDLETIDWSAIDALVLSPGVPLTHPQPHWSVKRAKDAGVEIIGDTEIFVRELAGSGAKLVAITGTNGKSTTTALVGHVLSKAGLDVQVGGNIGTFAVLDLEPPRPGRIYIIEFSSYQIDLTPGLKPDIGVLLNITPDHLDRHGTFNHYARVKERLFARQDDKDVAIVSIDDLPCHRILERRGGGAGRAVPVSAIRVPDNGLGAVGGRIFDGTDGVVREIASLEGARALRGAHNSQNAAMASAVARVLELDARQIAEGLVSFPGLAHRMEEVAHRGRVLFINDSKATNAEAAARALESFHAIYWIAGGRAKAGGIETLAPLFSRVTRAYLIGEAAEDFAATLAGKADHVLCSDLDEAVRRAATDAAASADSEPVVLLSPACASFDQFRSFEARGDAFREAVAALEGREC